MSQKSIMIMAGGTGGHVFPGLAVAHCLKAQGWAVTWLGNPKGMEAELVAKHGIDMQGISFGGVRGKGFLTKFMLPLNLLRAFAQSVLVLRKVKPDVVLGMGGYITFPAGMMAALLGRPLVLHEQNSIAGLANKVLRHVADLTLVAFPNSLPKAQWTGNPLRQELTQMHEPQARYAQRSGGLQVLVLGGSLGAKALNDVVPQALGDYAKTLGANQQPMVIHQTGKGNASAVIQAYADQSVQATVQEFIDDMPGAYAGADLVIARAGAMTVAELAAVGVASLLVPFPFAVDDHQTTNAQFLSNSGAAVLCVQSQCTKQWLTDWLKATSREQLLHMAIKARQLSKPQATQTVAQACISMVPSV
jgi:UDP-N-acetylglucosamine--N-acetylmuramyl-(pentapeptide) pyrophosphoryl-undecaprenol N-acetylglucosamine transferase